MRADNTRHIITAARQRTEQTRQRAVTTLRRMDAAGQPITLASLASQARVSRSWLYRQDDLLGEIERLRDRRPPPGRAAVPSRQRASSTSLLQRLEAATDRISRLESENQQLPTPWPAPSANAGPPKSSGRPTAATRRAEKPRRSFDRAETASPTCVGNTVLIVSAQVKAMIKVRAQDNPVDIQPAYDGHRDLLTLRRGAHPSMRIAYKVNPDPRLN
jgi:Family of unknown function (DUF6262)